MSSYRRPTTFSGYSIPRDDIGSRLTICALMAGAFVAFFWIYGTLVHREPLLLVPTQEPAPPPRDYAGWSAPAPDMHSAAITFANSDVTSAQRATATPEPQRPVAQAAKLAPGTRKHTKPLSPEAANAYASGADAAPRAVSAYPRREYGVTE